MFRRWYGASAFWEIDTASAVIDAATYGWMPTRSTPELIRQGRAILNELAVEAGRDPQSLEVLAYLVPADRAVLQALAEAGADAAVVRLEGDSEAPTLAQLEQIAQKVL